jgi:hypothetical protein
LLLPIAEQYKEKATFKWFDCDKPSGIVHQRITDSSLVGYEM